MGDWKDKLIYEGNKIVIKTTQTYGDTTSKETIVDYIYGNSSGELNNEELPSSFNLNNYINI